jgi:hypothetical protein
MSLSLFPSLVSLPLSPFPPLAVGFFGLGTGYLIYGPQELLRYPVRNESVDFGTGVWGIWMPGFMQFITGIYLFAGLVLFGTIRTPALYMAALAFTAYGVHWFAMGWNRLRRVDTRVQLGMAIAFLLISILGIIVFFQTGDDPVGGLFIGLACVYVAEFVASLKPDLPKQGGLGERALGFFHLGTGLWLMYLTFAVALNFILNYGLPLLRVAALTALGCAIRTGQGQAGGADVLAAVPGGHGGMPLARQRGQHRRHLTARGTDHQVDVLQRPLQRELRGEVATVHLVELGVGERRVERAALDDLGELLVADAEAIGKLHGLGHALDEDGQVGVDDQFHLAPAAGLTQPYGLAADDVEHRAHRAGRGRGPRRQDQQLTLFRWSLAARHRGVDEHHAWPLRGQAVPDALGLLDADRAHLRPHGPVSERLGQPAVEDDRLHGSGGGEHRDHDVRIPHRVPR